MFDLRTPDRIRHHYEVERELSDRLRHSTRGERTELFKSLYSELFRRVPDHPRLLRRETPEETQRSIQNQLRLLNPFLGAECVLVEFAPGDCHLAYAAAQKCRHAIGIDISDQRSSSKLVPKNFQLVVYDGYNLGLEDGIADLLFSYQFLEHLHPDDVDLHFEKAARLLKPEGVYVLDTPHRYSGPHDVSRFFGDDLVCFHFQEWTYRELRNRLQRHGFDRVWMYRNGRPVRSGFLNRVNESCESLLLHLPPSIRKPLSRRLFPAVTLAARKAA